MKIYKFIANILNHAVLILAVTWLCVFSLPAMAADESIAPGARIINMGFAVPTVGNRLKPYGLIYQLVVSDQVPVKWAINPNKAKDGVDFTADGIDYRGSAFIIEAPFVADAAATLSAWESKGVVISPATSTTFTAPIYDKITSFPRSVLDQAKGSIVQAYFVNAEIPTSAYRLGTPQSLNSCDDVYYMPHADPAWPTHKNLLPFIRDEGGSLWAACHAVSVLEAVENPLNPAENMRYLSNTGLIDFGDHDDAVPPFNYRFPWPNDPITQFIGTIDAATLNGSEQVYLPFAAGWRSSTTVAIDDPDHPDVLSGDSPGLAAKLAYGRAFGNSNAGRVVYEGGHTHDGTDAANLAAQRIAFNLLLVTGIERAPKISSFTIPPIIESEDTESFSISVTDGTGLYTYAWATTCGGSFDNPNGASTNYTAPSSTSDIDCFIRVTVQDSCGRKTFEISSVLIRGRQLADLSLTKTDSIDPVPSGGTFEYTLTVTNNGVSPAVNISLVDTLPPEVTLISATGTGWLCTGVTTVTCSRSVMGVGDVESVTIAVQAPAGVADITNNATVSSLVDDPDPANNSASEDTAVRLQIDLEMISKTVAPATIETNENADFSIVVKNNGPVVASNVWVIDPLPSNVNFVSAGDGVNWSCGYSPQPQHEVTCNYQNTLAIGATAPTLLITVSGETGGTASNTATVGTTDFADSAPANNQKTANLAVLSSADIGVVKTVANPDRDDGQNADFTITVTNYGPDPATNIVITDTWPILDPGFESPSNISPAADTGYPTLSQVRWTLPGPLAAGASSVFLLRLKKVGNDPADNTVAVVANEQDPDSGNNTDFVTVGKGYKSTDLSINKRADPISVAQGSNFSYYLTVSNNGEENLSADKYTMQVIDTLPAGVTYIAYTAADWSCTATGTPTVLTCDYTNTGTKFDKNTTLTDTIRIDVTAPVSGSSVINRASVSYTSTEKRVDNNSDNDLVELATVVFPPTTDVGVSKTFLPLAPKLGDEVTFTITLDNAADGVDATGVQVDDALPSGMTFVSATPSQGNFSNNTWLAGTINDGGTATLQVVATIDTVAEVINTATIVSLNELDSNAGNDAASVTVDVADADLMVEKINTTAPQQTGLGDSVIFRITLTNNGSNDATGESTATNVIVTDILPGGYTLVDPVADLSASAGTATYNATNHQISWQVASIAAAGVETLDVTLRADTLDTVSNNVAITASDLADNDNTNNSASAGADAINAQLEIEKVFVGERVVNIALDPEVIFEITVTNQGPDDATGVEVLDLLPDGLDYVSHTASNGDLNYSVATGVWSVGSIVSGSFEVLRIVTNANRNGTIVNTAAITQSDQPDSDPNNDDDQVVVLSGGQADLFLIKSVDDASVTLGDTVTFILSLTNYGPDAATSIVVQDILPAGLQFESGSASKGSYNSADGKWTGFSLLDQETATLQISAQTTSTGTIVNEGVVLSSDQGDPDPTSDTSQSAIEVFPPGTLVSIFGTVYADDDDSGSLNGIEAGIGDAIWVKLVSGNDLTTAIEAVPVDPVSGSYSFNSVPNGNYILVIDDNGDPADVNAGTPAYWNYRTPNNGTRTLTLNSADVTDQNFGLTPAAMLSALAGDVLINEVQFRETGTSAGVNNEFIELYNTSASSVDLSGFQLADSNVPLGDNDGAGNITGSSVNPAYIFPPGTVLQAGEYSVVWIGEQNATNDAPMAAFQTWLGNSAKLDNTGDDVWLYDNAGAIIDYMAYGTDGGINTPPPANYNLWDNTYQSSLASVASGQSVSLTPNGFDTNSSECWEATTSDNAAARCTGHIPTIDADGRVTTVSSAGINNNVLPGVSVRGRVYLDANHNAQMETAENGIANVTIVIRNLLDDSCDAVITDANGYYEFATVANGQYEVVEAATTAPPVNSPCTPLAADLSGHISTTSNVRVINVTGTPVSNQNFGDFAGSKITGTVFEDNGAGGGVAHDGVQSGSETGIGDLSVSAIDTPSTLIDSIVTAADGTYTLWVPDTVTSISLTTTTGGVYVSISESAGNTDATTPAGSFDEMSFSVVAGTEYSGVNFGDVRTPAFNPDHTSSAMPGTTVNYPHTFTTHTAGAVTFAVVNQSSSPVLDSWSTTLFQDSNCNAVLDANEPVITAPFTVDADTSTQVCVIAKVFVPASAPLNAHYKMDVQATFNYDGDPIPASVQTQTDLTTVGDSSGLVIIKQVDKVKVLPGDSLTYTITYRNTSDEPLDDIVVTDATPPFTTFVSASCGALPVNITACTVTTQPAPGNTGTVEWTMDNVLAPGQQGEVTYEVLVDN